MTGPDSAGDHPRRSVDPRELADAVWLASYLDPVSSRRAAAQPRPERTSPSGPNPVSLPHSAPMPGADTGADHTVASARADGSRGTQRSPVPAGGTSREPAAAQVEEGPGHQAAGAAEAAATADTRDTSSSAESSPGGGSSAAEDALSEAWAAGRIGPAADRAGRQPAGRAARRTAVWSPAAYPALNELTGQWRGLRRALGDVRQLVASEHRTEVDDEATAGWLARGRARPVYRPVSELRYELVLVVDDNWTMAIWHDQIRRQLAMLERLAVFRNVGVYYLDTDVTEGRPVQLRGASRSEGGFSPARLHDASRRQIIWLLTDGLGAAWRRGVMDPVLWAWSRRQPTAVLSVVPRPTLRHSWLEVCQLEEYQALRPTADEAVPLLDADLWSIRRWALRLTDTYQGEAEKDDLPVVVVGPTTERREDDGHEDRDAQAGPPATRNAELARRRVERFRATASPAAFDLATHLAAAPITRSMLGLLLRRAGQPRRSGLATLAELFAHGLLRPVEGLGGDDWAVAYDFLPGLRETLLSFLRRSDTMLVMRAVGEQLGARVPAVRHLSAALDNPDDAPLPEVAVGTEHFLAVEAVAFGALSGPYLPRYRRLSSALLRFAHTDGAGIQTAGSARHTLSQVSPSDEASAPPRPRTGAVEDTPVSVSRRAPTIGESLTSTTHAPSQVERRTPRKPIIWGNVPPRNLHFTGRVDLLENLRARMAEGTTAVLPEALHGMGGVGKSHLALEYVYKHGREYDLVWWIAAEHAAQIGASFVDLALRLNLPVSTEQNTAVPAVLDALRLGKPHERWLLIFDNADDPRVVQSFFPESETGRILVTSRNPNWDEAARPLRVDVFDRAESVELLRKRIPELTDEDADKLAAALGDLPLAVAQAASWLAETGMPAHEYLRLFEDKRAELLSTSPPAGYDLPVQVAWDVSLDRLADTHPSAMRLLQVWSFFAPEQIPRQIFRGGRAVTAVPDLDVALRDPIRLADAIRQITRYALALLDPQRNSIQMHRLVQRVLQSRMTSDEQAMMRRAAHLLLAVNDPGEPDNPRNWRAYSELYPHLIASNAAESTDPWMHDLLVNEVIYLYKWGDHERSLELAQKVHDTWVTTLGENAPATLRLTGWLGWMYFVLGHYEDAARTNTRQLALCTEVHGNDHVETLAVLGNGVVDRFVSGDFDDALLVAVDRMGRAMRAYGEDNEETLKAAHDRGAALRFVGRPEEARRLDQDTWERRLRLLGEYHLDTLSSLLSLALDERELGDYLGALHHHEEHVALLIQAVEGRQDHFEVLKSQAALAVTRRKAGRHGEALELAEDVQFRLSRRYGKDHPRTLAASLALSVDLRHAGELAAAQEMGEAAHRRYERAFGETHPFTSAATLGLAIIFRLSGRPEKAHELDVAALAALDARLGPDHPYTLTAATNLASDLFAMGDFAHAHVKDVDSFERSRRVLGDEHPSTLVLAANLAMDLRSVGRSEEGDELAGRTVLALGRALGTDHPATRGAASTIRSDCDIEPLPL